MPSNDLRVHIAVEDRLMLHLLEQDEQLTTTWRAAVTRPGIAEACAMHPPMSAVPCRRCYKSVGQRAHSNRSR